MEEDQPTYGHLELVGLYWRTLRHLRPSQIAHRLRLRSQRTVLSHLPRGWERPFLRDVPDAPGWPHEFKPIDAQLAEGGPSPEANAVGVFKFLNEERRLGDPPDWQQADSPQLWRYHLHYFEWAWGFADHADREWARQAFAHIWASWSSACPAGKGDPWSPYVVSLRLWVLCGVFEELATPKSEAYWRCQIHFHLYYLRTHIEFDVGGNHLIKNLKGLIGGAVFLGSNELVAKACRQLDRQLKVQILTDGGHYERSPSYHCQVLGDLLDIQNLLVAADMKAAVPPELSTNISRMQAWLGTMLMPDGDVPLFNDCVLVGRERIAALAPIIPEEAKLTILVQSGYLIVKPQARLHLIADIGESCPRDLPAHAHADCLSFELAVDGRRVFVNSGTSTYSPNARRRFERSTAAHNTVELDGIDQTEVWGAFRVGRRAQAILEACRVDDEGIYIVASHDGYRHLPDRPIHRRSWRIHAGLIAVDDIILGDTARQTHRSISQLYLHDAAEISRISDRAINIGAVTVYHDSSAVIAQSEISDGFNHLLPAKVVRVGASGPLPHRLSLELSLGDLRQIPGFQ